MDNPFQIVMLRITQNIPKDLLTIAVRHFNKENHKNYTITSFIQEHIMARIVLPEANLSGGLIKTIPLQNSWIETTSMDHGGYAGDDGPYSLYRIPPEVRDNKPISNLLSIQYPYNTYLGGGVNSSDIGLGGYCLVDQLDEVLNSYTLARPRNHPVGRLLSGDLVRITPTQYSVQNWLMTCRIDFDSTFTNLNAHAIPVLADLVMYAMKQWIHTNLMIDIDRAAVETGADIGTIKSIVEGYADAGQQYAETMVKYRGAAGFLDPDYRRRLMVYQI